MGKVKELRAPRIEGDIPRPEIIVNPRMDLAAELGVNLRHAGYVPTMADSAEAARPQLDTALPDLLILDWMLPGQSGIDFARALPRLRRRVARDLKRHGLPREKVLAAVVRFMESTLIRVGNDEYAKCNKSFGLTTLRDHHAKISRRKVKLEFRAMTNSHGTRLSAVMMSSVMPSAK